MREGRHNGQSVEVEEWTKSCTNTSLCRVATILYSTSCIQASYGFLFSINSTHIGVAVALSTEWILESGLLHSMTEQPDRLRAGDSCHVLHLVASG